ncbi:PHRF1 [Symbiodinium natans]|uniref:PHRF1 protein n=1 Tax=Symbiodinium natans TaxID=878477 RepID=A0A812LDT5_9DINO|nr:PHRF1 [Symbiodinium natans]
MAKAVTLFGPGVVVLPLLGRVSGLEEEGCLEYSSHPKRVAKGGVLDRVDMEMKYGAWDPKRLMEELTSRKKGLERRIQRLSNEDLQEEVHAMQDWREKASGRLKTLERRAAWSFLGVVGEGRASQEDIKKAFKKRALELHPDKGGDAERFRLLQEMRDLLVEPKKYQLEGVKEKSEAGKKDKTSSQSKEEVEDEDESELSEDSWDADEEFRKMFPKRKKRPRRSGDDDEAEPDNLQSQDFHRGKFEAARRKLHRQVADMWTRASKLSEEIARSQTTGSSSEAMRQLRRFVELFCKKEAKQAMFCAHGIFGLTRFNRNCFPGDGAPRMLGGTLVRDSLWVGAQTILGRDLCDGQAPKKRKLPTVRARSERVVARDILTTSAPTHVRCGLDKGERVCGACLLPIESDAQVGAIDNCTHLFHHGCVEKWSQTENTCPQCKTRFFWLAAYDELGKRTALTRIQSKDQEEQEDDAFDEVSVCERCHQVGDESQLLLCDGMHGTCNATFHVACVGLDEVPRGSWFCPDCLERGFDVDAQGNRGTARETCTENCEAVEVTPRRARTHTEDTTLEDLHVRTPPAAEPPRRPTRGRLPSQLQLSALACVTPAVEVPTFQRAEPQRQPEGLFAAFAARRRARRGSSEAQETTGFISLNPSYEDDFMANQKAKG